MGKANKLLIVLLLSFSLVGCKKSEGELMGQRITKNAMIYKDDGYVEYEGCKNWYIYVTFTGNNTKEGEVKNISITHHNKDMVEYRIDYPVNHKKIGKGSLQEGTLEDQTDKGIEVVFDHMVKDLGCSKEVFIDFSNWYYHNQGVAKGRPGADQ